jgi:hypothetical protein
MRRRLGRGSKVALALAVPVVVLVAFLGGRASTPRAEATAAAGRSDVVPAEGAEAFAVGAVRELNSPQMVDSAYRSAALTRFLDRSAEGLADRFVPGPAFEEATGLAADQSAGRTTVAQVVPLAVSSTAAGRGQVRVSVWAVTVVGTRRFGQLVASWSTESLTVRHEAVGWRVVDYRSLPGPVPAATQPPTDVTSALVAVSSMKSVVDAR